MLRNQQHRRGPPLRRRSISLLRLRCSCSPRSSDWCSRLCWRPRNPPRAPHRSSTRSRVRTRRPALRLAGERNRRLDRRVHYRHQRRARRGRQVQDQDGRPFVPGTLYRLGWYDGAGARQVGTFNGTSPQNQPDCLRDGATGLADCGNWAVSLSWQVPADAVSGLYYARLHRNDDGGENEIVFVVRDDTSQSKVLFQTSDSTWQAYNRLRRRQPLLGDRPGATARPSRSATTGRSRCRRRRGLHLQRRVSDDPLARANGYDLSYTTDVDTARRGHLIKNHKVFMAVGHDEYWSNEQRANVEAARDAGVNLAFFTATRFSGRHAGSPASTASATRLAHARLLQGDARRARPTRPPSGPAPGATRGSARPRTAAGRRTRCWATSSRSTAARRLAAGAGRRTGRCGSGATRRSRSMAAGQTYTLPARHARLRVGHGRGQRIPARRAVAQLSRTTVEHRRP